MVSGLGLIFLFCLELFSKASGFAVLLGVWIGFPFPLDWYTGLDIMFRPDMIHRYYHTGCSHAKFPSSDENISGDYRWAKGTSIIPFVNVMSDKCPHILKVEGLGHYKSNSNDGLLD